jgi:hypothetical protein
MSPTTRRRCRCAGDNLGDMGFYPEDAWAVFGMLADKDIAAR